MVTQKHCRKLTSTKNVHETERAANNCGCFVSESVITNCSPDTVVVQFKTTFSWTWTSDQSHCKQHFVQNVSRQMVKAATAIVSASMRVFYCYNHISHFPVKKMHSILLRGKNSDRLETLTKLTRFAKRSHFACTLPVISQADILSSAQTTLDRTQCTSLRAEEVCKCIARSYYSSFQLDDVCACCEVRIGAMRGWDVMV